MGQHMPRVGHGVIGVFIVIITIHCRILGFGKREDKISGILEGNWRIQRGDEQIESISFPKKKKKHIFSRYPWCVS